MLVWVMVCSRELFYPANPSVAACWVEIYMSAQPTLLSLVEDHNSWGNGRISDLIDYIISVVSGLLSTITEKRGKLRSHDQFCDCLYLTTCVGFMILGY
jgi:hypothetical protein